MNFQIFSDPPHLAALPQLQSRSPADPRFWSYFWRSAHLWKWISRRLENIFEFFQKFSKSILSSLNIVFDRFGIHL